MSTSEFERWQERFAAPGYLFGTAPNEFLKATRISCAKARRRWRSPTAKAATACSWPSRGSTSLSVDFSPLAQDKARKLAAERGVTLRVEQVDIINWDWPAEAFDVVAAIFFQFTGPAGRDKIFAGIKKALKPGGLLLLEGYGPKQLEYKTGGPPHLENLYTRELLEKAFGDFASIEVRAYDAEINEGPGHGGMSALVDLVGRK